MILGPRAFAVVPAVIAPVDDDAVESYAAMDAAILALPTSTELGSAILPCQQPCIEVTVTDEENLPLANVPYRLLLEGAVLAQGTLDQTGFVSVPEQELPPGEWNIEITLQRNESTQVLEGADILLTARPAVVEEQAQDAPQVTSEPWLPFVEAPYSWE